MTNYLNDAESYAKDLTDAANAGDWERYRNIQAQLVVETNQALAAQTVQAERGKAAIIDELEETHRGFKAFYGSDSYQQVLADHPRLAEAISTASENTAFQTDYLQDYLLLALDCAMAKGSYLQPQQQSRQQTTPLRSETTSVGLTEQAIFSATQESKQVDLSSKNRRALIQQLEESGAADIEF
jgi:hypothetical protein